MGRHARAPEIGQRSVDRWRAAEVARRAPHDSQRKAASRLARCEHALRRLNAELHDIYGTPHLGNLSDPTDEFVYIVLARKTPERAYQSAFRRLKASGDWSWVAACAPQDIASAIHGCGLEQKKARAILEGLATIKVRFGAIDLRRASSLPDDELLQFLSSLPEIGPKSALCVMLYSFGRPVFPVDAHVGRVLARLGILNASVPGLDSMDHKAKQRALADAVPPDLRYGLHVNLLSHGRATCRATNPLCERCPLWKSCSYAQSPRTTVSSSRSRGGR